MLEDIGLTGQKFVLIFFRVASVLWFLPLLSAQSISKPYKAGLSLLISFLLINYVDMGNTVVSDPFHVALLVMREVLIGVTIGFFVRMLFMAVNVAGELAALQAGFGFARFMDPYTNTQVTELTQILNILTLMIFFAMDGHHIVIKGLVLSFREVPLGSAVLKQPLLQYLITLTGKVFSLGLRIGAPIIITLFLTELSLGILSKMVPQVNVFIEGLPLKILITIGMLSFSLGILAPLIAGLFRGMDSEIPKILRSMG